MSFIEEVRALEQFTKLPRATRNLVIYSEGAEYWPHFRGIVHELLHTQHCPFIFVSSSARDPGLRLRHPLVQTYNVGVGGARKNFFSDVEADIMALTMPDIGKLTLKKSNACGEYVYIFHSPVSTHLIYREGAFDHYDTVFCAGPHHEAEIRARENQKGLPAKRLFQHGYGRLDEIITGMPERKPETEAAPIHALIAPSWGPNGLFETIGAELVSTLLDAGLKVTARPHPQTSRLNPDAISALKSQFQDNPLFTLETDMADKTSFHESDIAISDWSGAAFDYAFSRLRPVVFIDTPKKTNNPAYQELGIEPMEASIRTSIGAIVSSAELGRLSEVIGTLTGTSTVMRDTIASERARWIYNVGESARIAAAELARLAFNASLGDDGAVSDLDARCRKSATELLGATTSPEIDPDGTLSLHKLLSALIEQTSETGSEEITRLEALCRRIDIFKKLHEAYISGFAKPAGAKTEAGRNLYPALAFCLIRAASQTGATNLGLSLKFLNSAANALADYREKGGVKAAIALESLLMRAFDNAGAGR